MYLLVYQITKLNWPDLRLDRLAAKIFDIHDEVTHTASSVECDDT